MPLILLATLIAVLPLAMTNTSSHVLLLSIYAGLAHLVSFIAIAALLRHIMRKQRIADWRKRRRS
ncbi:MULTISPECIES: hypothetical protein [Methylobacillus]|uniref:hypothetical protein n=1 Tax=Methylobacillus TaxID=404 RepID=UPI00030E028D|nr:MULTISPECIES: hypothetical protein [Methylobacillus]MPS49448.1 hypothetical protein [Methylobacillus sp.]